MRPTPNVLLVFRDKAQPETTEAGIILPESEQAAEKKHRATGTVFRVGKRVNDGVNGRPIREGDRVRYFPKDNLVLDYEGKEVEFVSKDEIEIIE